MPSILQDTAYLGDRGSKCVRTQNSRAIIKFCAAILAFVVKAGLMDRRVIVQVLAGNSGSGKVEKGMELLCRIIKQLSPSRFRVGGEGFMAGNLLEGFLAWLLLPTAVTGSGTRASPSRLGGNWSDPVGLNFGVLKGDPGSLGNLGALKFSFKLYLEIIIDSQKVAKTLSFDV
jgi:hypothetical protein